ncbi:unnamed protein product [Rotaria sordida]|uniref:Uncharacterized protein n=1 Tax=Rotaria sordida TaxID=392033 RepID=A0A818QQR6_9BILA|nr:unnamed protein product [Rotaria sordida]CAF3642928.1 unnamed protein product [Rotaria sordida]CAF3898714.1 unnamed protein product [Rotaria sordida]
MFHCNVSNLDRENAKDLFNIILDDQFLFLIHMHYDLHESVLGDRQNFSNDCREHISQLPEELTKRFTPSVVQGNLSILFDPQYLIQHKNNISSTGYGRGVN